VLIVRTAVVGPFAENCFLVGCSATKEALVVDPGGEESRVLGMRMPGDFRVVRIVLTHGHIDHVAGAAALQEATGAPVTLHAEDADWLDSLPQQAATFGFEYARRPALERYHADGDTFGVGEHQARIIHTPGHTRGGCSIWFESDRVLFTGDTLFAASVGRTDLPGGDFAILEASVRERLFPLGDDVRFYPGHGPGGLLGEERSTNPFVGESMPRARFL
jgi:glyoxylase-like metal-dependent hydrolase (beta-lactamase superfamily II)